MGMLLGIWETILHGMRESFFLLLLKWTRQFQVVEKPQNWLLMQIVDSFSFAFFSGDLKVAIGFLVVGIG